MTFADLMKGPAPARPNPKPALYRAAAALAGFAALAGATHAANPVVKMILALGLMLAGAVYGLRWLAKGGLEAAQPIRVVGRTALSAKAAVAIVEADGRRYLLAFGDGYCQLVADHSTKSGGGAP